MKINFWIALLLTLVVMFIVGAVLEMVIILPIRESDHLTLLMITIGLSIGLKQLAVIIWGSIGAVFPTIFGDQAFEINGVYLVPQNLWVLFIGCVIMVLLYFLIYKTKLGMTMRAVSQSRETASLMGVNTRRMDMITFGLGAALAAIAGVFMAPLTYVEPAMSGSVGVKGFVAAVIGGFGSLFGAVLGGLMIGLIETLSSFVINSGYKDAVVFFILIIVLTFRPQGLFVTNKSRTKVKKSDPEKGGDKVETGQA